MGNSVLVGMTLFPLYGVSVVIVPEWELAIQGGDLTMA
jgi:hypothetical protein